MAKYDILEVYPNSPLAEVVCEIRFPCELAIECRRNEFHDEIRNKYPGILIQQSDQKPVNFLAPYRFENADQNAGILLAVNRFSFYDKDYSGHKLFTKEFGRLAELLVETYPIKELNRLGWRYINIIPFSRKDGLIPLKQFLNFGFILPKGVSDEFKNLSVVFVSEINGGTITTRIESMIRVEDQQETLLLDFDFSMTEALSFSNISSHINEAHKKTRELFENLITDNYRQYLRGETL